MCEMTNRDIGLGMLSSPIRTSTGYRNPFEYPSIQLETPVEKIMKIVNQVNKELEEEMYKLTGYEINATETGVEIEIVIPGVKKEDVSVKFQKDSYIVSYIDRDGEEEVVAIHLGQIDDEAIANLDTDFEKNGHDITIALGILTIKVPYRSEETEELTIKEVV